MSRALTGDERNVLAVLLRARPETLRALRVESTVQGAAFDHALDGLVGLGFLTIVDDRIALADPESIVADLASRIVADQRDRLGEIDQLLSLMPGLARDRQLGLSREADTIPVQLVHGTGSQWELWLSLIAAEPPNRPIAVFPDFGGLAKIVVENMDALTAARAQLGFSLRTITVSSTLADPQQRAQLAQFTGAGIELRTLPAVPGWFYVDPGVLAALPLSWGEAVPTSIALVREPAVLAPLAAYIEELWDDAHPLVRDSDLDPVLALLAQGLSDGAIASALGTSVRTVRRRIADAAEAHGVTSRFALGAAWERSRKS